MIIDLSIGFNELALFAIRYNELKNIVDRFVVVECTHTHRGNPKPMYFTEWANGARTWNGFTFDAICNPREVEILQIDNGPAFAPTHPDYSWVRENYQREVLGQWAKNNLNDDDICMLSDMDEIPRANALYKYLYEPYNDYVAGVRRFEQDLSYLYFNTTAGKWCGTKIFEVQTLKDMMGTVRPMTDLVRYRPEHMIQGTILNGGWHFSSCGGLPAVREKFDSYAHTEMSGKTSEDIQDSIDRIVDPFHKQPLTVVATSTLPQYVRENLNLFEEYVYGA